MSSYVDRFRGIEQLYGKGSLTKLQKSRITVVGLGGVGSWVVEGLVRCGIGNLQLIDIDEICLHNTNRQAYANISTIGQSKAQVLKEQALQINPDCLIDIEQTFFKAKNAQVILDNSGSIIIDAIDAYQEKSLLIAESKKRQLEVITIGSTGGKKLNSDIQVDDLSVARDPLLRKVRTTLRQEYKFVKGASNPQQKPKKMKVHAVYSQEPIIMLDECNQPIKQQAGFNCQTGLGASMLVTASFAMRATAKAIDLIID